MDTDESEWRSRIQRQLGYRLPDKRWRKVAEFALEDLISGSIELSDVLHFIGEREEWARLSGDQDAEPLFVSDAEGGDQGRASEYWERQRAISHVCAAEAAEDADVTDFREKHLGGGLIEWARIEEWLRARAEEDGPATRYITDLPLPPGTEVKGPPSRAFTEPPTSLAEESPAWFGWKIKMVSYHRHDSRWPFRLPIAHGGVLDHLRGISQDLVKAFDWTEAAATTFVVTGTVPVVAAVGVRYSVRHKRPALSRVSLNVDLAVSPRDLMKYYSDVRQGLVQGRRYRPMSRKSLQLAEFRARCPPAESWEESMTRWNEDAAKAEPDWQYNDAERFGHDCRVALSTLMRPSFLAKDVQATVYRVVTEED